MIQARDATGRQVSLLNEDPYAQRHPAYSTSTQFQSAPDRSPLPPTPALLRSASYDSNASYDAISPLTPGVYDYSPRSVYDDYCFPEKSGPIQRPAYVESSRSNSYEDDSGNAAAVPERATKRYPCRYRDSHGCEKTFTTSGHASRHSKIHTAEKAVQCTYPGCHKKFTRADNMKQHLETHYKDKSRSSSSSKASCKSSSFSSKRASISSKSSSSHSSRSPRAVHMWDADQCGSDLHSLPLSGGAWDIHEFNGGFVSRPVTGRTSSGLDALAAIACQEGA